MCHLEGQVFNVRLALSPSRLGQSNGKFYIN